MAQEAKTIDEQIALLKERGMIFDNEEKAKEILEDVGYYRLGFYWYHFQKNPKKRHLFQENTHFSTIIDLYYLDVDLRFLLIKVLSRIEINLRTHIIYAVSNHYKENPTWFSDEKIVGNQYLSTFDNFYNEIKINNHIITKHHNCYPKDRYAPAWKTLEYMTLGSLYKLFCSLQEKNVKKQIASKYKIRNIRVFDNYFKIIRNIRNICSHTRVLYNLRYHETIANEKPIPISDDEKNALGGIVKIISYFLEQISANRAKQFQDDLKDILLRHSDNKILMKILKNKTKISLPD